MRYHDIIFTAVIITMLIGVIESLWHDYIYVICSSLLHLGVSTHPRARASSLGVCSHPHRSLALDLSWVPVLSYI